MFERRVRAEWEMLNDLAVLNPGRLTGLRADDTTFHATLHVPFMTMAATGTVPSWEYAPRERLAHAFCVHYPVHFPAVPMEMFLQTPALHPNIHPETGFVCLWERHRASNTVEHAVHKLLAMLEGRLYNADPVHVMQPDVLLGMQSGEKTACGAPLAGVTHEAYAALAAPVRRRRLL